MTESRELKVALEAADSAGEIVRGFYRQRFDVWQKSKDQPVTDADLAADKTLKSVLLGAFPNDGWLSEETADSPERLSVRRLWVVDPIDGTKEFIRAFRSSRSPSPSWRTDSRSSASSRTRSRARRSRQPAEKERR